MKQEKTIFLNENGIMLVCIVIMLLTFALGFTLGGIKETKTTIFTSEDLERIVEVRAIEDAKKSGAEVYVCKDENGNLMIGWNYDDLD